MPTDSVAPRTVPARDHAVARLMGALLREPDDEPLEQVLTGIVDELGLGEETVEAIRRMDAEVARLRMRARNLEILYETAGDLSALHDVEEVLKAIVRRGRAILGTDVAYLMLIDDERGDTYMRVSEGTVGQRFRAIRLPLGTGLGGLVAQTAMPLWTSDYLADTRFEHAVDGEVIADRLTAILGVPLVIGREVIGVLFAADRHPRDFLHDEVSLLCSLADHAAVALRSASLLAETRQSLAELTTAKLREETRNESLRRAAEIHERLNGLLLAGATEQDLASALVEVLRGTLLVVSPSGRLIARAGSVLGLEEIDGPEPGSVVMVDGVPLLHDVDPERHRGASTRHELLGRSCRLAPVRAGKTHLGWLVYLGSPLVGPDERSLENTATATALLWMTQRAKDEAENRLRRDILADALSGHVLDPESTYRRAEMLCDGDLRGPLSVLTVLPCDRQPDRAEERETVAVARAHHGLAANVGGRIIVVVPRAEQSRLVEALLEKLSRPEPAGRGGVTIGVDDSSSGLGTLAEAEARSHRCARVLQVLGSRDAAASADQLGVFGLLVSHSSAREVQDFVAQTLGVLEGYDARRGTDLVSTLESFFDHEGAVAAVADALYVHPNTVYNRLDRVERLLGGGWRTGERSLSLRVALKLRHLLVR